MTNAELDPNDGHRLMKFVLNHVCRITRWNYWWDRTGRLHIVADATNRVIR